MAEKNEDRVLLNLSERQADEIEAALARQSEVYKEAGPAYAQDLAFIEELREIVRVANPYRDEQGNPITEQEAFADAPWLLPEADKRAAS
jgi:hypothetical protein